MSRTPRTDFRALFPIGLPVTYHTVAPESSGKGQSLVIGSDLVRFLSDRDLAVGQKLRLELAWPAPLPDGTGLNLWLYGSVARSSFAEVEMRVTKYEFRTRRKAQPATALTSTNTVAVGARVARAGA